MELERIMAYIPGPWDRPIVQQPTYRPGPWDRPVVQQPTYRPGPWDTQTATVPPSAYRAGWWDQLGHAFGTELFPGIEQGLSLGFYQPSWQPSTPIGRSIRGAARFAGELPAYSAAVAGAAAIPGLGEAEAAALMPALVRAGVAGLGLGTIRGIAGVTHGAPLSSIPRTSAEEAATWLSAELGTRALAPAWNIVKPLLPKLGLQGLAAADHASNAVRQFLDLVDKPLTSPTGKPIKEISHTPATDVIDGFLGDIQNILKRSPSMQFADWFDQGVARLYTHDFAVRSWLTGVANNANRIGLTEEDNRAMWDLSNWYIKAKRRRLHQQELALHPFPGKTPPRTLSTALEPKPTLSPAAQKVWNDVLKPLWKRLADDYRAMTGKEPLDLEHLSRYVKSERLTNDMSLFMEEGHITRAGVLSKGLRTIHSLQHRNYYHVRSDQYGDFTAQIDKQGRVFLFRDGSMVQPYEGYSTSVLEEDDMAAAKPLFNRKFSVGQVQRARMSGKFTDRYGTEWRLSTAVTDEIERDTPWKFYHQVVPNVLLQLTRMERGVQFQRFLVEMAARPEAQEMVRALKSGVEVPAGWSRGPGSLSGYAFSPIAKGVVDRWWTEGKGITPQTLRWLAGTARNLIFVLPLLHVSNIVSNWTIDRGARWASIPAYQRLFTSSSQTLRYLTGKLGDTPEDKKLWDYVFQAQKAGLRFMRDLPEEHVVPTYARTAGIAMMERPRDLSTAARALGFINPVNLGKAWMAVSRNITWWMDDGLRLQALLEERALGRKPAEAVARISEHIPDYVVPTYVAGSNTLSKAFRTQNLLVFGPYHYNLLASYGRWATALLTKVPLKKKAEAAGQLGVLALLLLWAYPKLDQLAKHVTGNEAAYLGRAGMARIPWNMYRVATGQTGGLAAASSLFTPNPLWAGTWVGVTGYNPYTMQREVEPDATGAQRVLGGLHGAATEAIAPLRYGSQIATGQLNPLTFGLSGFPGVQMPKTTPAQRKLQTDLYDERTFIEGERSRAFRNGDLSREAELRVEYNQRLLEDIAGVLQESGLSPALGQLYFRHYSMKPFSQPSQQRLMTPALPIPMRILRRR